MTQPKTPQCELTAVLWSSLFLSPSQRLMDRTDPVRNALGG
ncbi:hypothetical protein ABE237_08195 [Brevibacillus formosus]